MTEKRKILSPHCKGSIPLQEVRRIIKDVKKEDKVRLLDEIERLKNGNKELLMNM